MLVTKEVKVCADCPYASNDGGPGSAFACAHPDAPYMGYVLNWRESVNRISEHCPIKKEQQ